VAQESSSNALVLAVFSSEEDRTALGEIFGGLGWSLRAATTVTEARSLLNRSFIGAVICESSFPDGNGWTDLLAVIQDLIEPPPLIVADRLADERLWAEVLNLGGYDLLAKPFQAREVLDSVSTACRWRENRDRAIAARLRSKPAARRGGPTAKNRPGCGSRRRVREER
jgi:DNA-binding NtrC family response regulator